MTDVGIIVVDANVYVDDLPRRSGAGRQRDHILLMVVHALRRHGLDHKVIRQYAYAVRDLAVRSSGGYHERVPETQTDCPAPKTTRSSISRSWWTRT